MWILKSAWALALVVYVVIGFAPLRYFWLELALPPLLLTLSFAVFHDAVRPIRRIHHWVVSIALVGGAAGVLWMVFLFPKEQSPVGGFFLVVTIGRGYIALLVLLAISRAGGRLIAAFRDRPRQDAV